MPESSSWSSASVGRATATLQKVTPETWEQQDLLGWMCWYQICWGLRGCLMEKRMPIGWLGWFSGVLMGFEGWTPVAHLGVFNYPKKIRFLFFLLRGTPHISRLANSRFQVVANTCFVFVLEFVLAQILPWNLSPWEHPSCCYFFKHLLQIEALWQCNTHQNWPAFGRFLQGTLAKAIWSQDQTSDHQLAGYGDLGRMRFFF